jgi:outer membrane autotransporter protein
MSEKTSFLSRKSRLLTALAVSFLAAGLAAGPPAFSAPSADVKIGGPGSPAPADPAFNAIEKGTNSSDDYLHDLNVSDLASPFKKTDPFGDGAGNGSAGVFFFSSAAPADHDPKGLQVVGNVRYTVVGGVDMTGAKTTSTGPRLASGTGNGNKVVVTGTVGGLKTGAASTYGSVFGGLSIGRGAETTVNNNIVIVGGPGNQAAKVYQSVFGGASLVDDKIVGGNLVVMNDKSEVLKGGDAVSGRLVGGSLGKLKDGGYDDAKGAVVRNKVVVNGGEANAAIGGEIINGAAAAKVENNSVEIIGGKINEDVVGGLASAASPAAEKAAVTGNKAHVGGGRVAGSIYGGKAYNGDATTNMARVTGGSLAATTNVVGAATLDPAGTGKLAGNKVEVSGAALSLVKGASTASTAHGEISGNKATVGGNSTVNGVVGGQGGSAAARTISQNEVVLRGVTVNQVSGQNYDNVVAGGLGVTGNTGVTKNTVVFESGANVVNTALHGGYAGATAATDNKIVILNGDNTVNGLTKVFGELKIEGGRNAFKNTVETGQADKGITIVGGDTSFAGDVTANGGTLSITDARVAFGKITVVAKNVAVGRGGVLDVGGHVATTNADLDVKAGSTLMFGKDGAIRNTGATTVAGDVVVTLKAVDGDADYWVGRELITTTGKLTNNGAFKNLFHTVAAANAQTGGKVTVTGRVAFADVVGKNNVLPAAPTPNVEAVLALMDRVDASKASPALVAQMMGAVQSIVDNVAPERRGLALRQLAGESLVNVNAAATTSAVRTQGVVLNRLDRVREAEGDAPAPPAAGSGLGSNRLWAGGFGTRAKAKDRDHVSGYDYKASGVSLGYDRKVEAVPGLRLGVGASWSSGELENNDRLTAVDLDTAGFGVYGSYTLRNGVFFDASVAYANTESDYAVRLLTGGVKTGAYDVDTWQYGLRAGLLAKIDRVQIIPSVGLRILSLRQDAWTEKLDGAAVLGGALANTYGRESDRQVDIPFQLKLNTTVGLGRATLTPELRLGYTLTARKPDRIMRVGFIGAPGQTARIVGIRPSASSYQVGAGFKLNTGSMIDVFLNYDLDAAKSFRNHNASLGLGFDF